MNDKMMGCGHSANAKNEDGGPVCAICVGLDPRATVIVEPPNLSGRKAHCSYGAHAIVDSSIDLAFFEHRPDVPEDVYYCGCYGWD